MHPGLTHMCVTHRESDKGKIRRHLIGTGERQSGEEAARAADGCSAAKEVEHSAARVPGRSSEAGEGDPSGSVRGGDGRRL
jgi:hypothetical protein